MTHVCSDSNSRCMKVVGDKIMCRMKDYPECSYAHYKEKSNVYSDEVYQILNELGLAESVTPDWDERFLSNEDDLHWKVHKNLEAGNWYYKLNKKGEGCKYSPVIPMMAAMLRSSCNVQLCSGRFMVSYLVKCVAGKEIRKSPNFISGSNTGEIIPVSSSSAAPNEKISGVKYHKEHKVRKNIAKADLCD